MGGQERHTHTRGTVRRESFMDEHCNTIKPDTARCYMCRRYGNRYIKQPKSIWLINILSNGWRSSSSTCWNWPSLTVGSNDAKQYRQCRKVWVTSSYKRKASLAATKADITLHLEQNIPNLATMNDGTRYKHVNPNVEVCLPVLRNATWNSHCKQYHSRSKVNTLLVIFKTNTSKAIHCTQFCRIWSMLSRLSNLTLFFTACHSINPWYKCH